MSSVYCPHIHCDVLLLLVLRYCDDFLRYFSTLGQYFIARKDFNDKHLLKGCSSNVQKGKSPYSILSNCHFSFVSPPEPTYRSIRSNRNPDIVDFFITNILNHKK